MNLFPGVKQARPAFAGAGAAPALEIPGRVGYDEPLFRHQIKHGTP
ncbi:hypothetical protein ACFO0J_16780 [Castellaniella hirudinis]|uniref:Uncharacterized protein n=1 Tax=Castellaniella hirudinis TaxID=1144617 RepID=A0ABV8S235_9BURK